MSKENYSFKKKSPYLVVFTKYSDLIPKNISKDKRCYDGRI